MTSLPARDQAEDHLLTPKNCALVLIDYQPIQVGSIASMDRRDLVMNIVAVARTAKLYGPPIVLSTVNVKTGANQPTIPQLVKVLDGIEALARACAEGYRTSCLDYPWTVCVIHDAVDVVLSHTESDDRITRPCVGTPLEDDHRRFAIYFSNSQSPW